MARRERKLARLVLAAITAGILPLPAVSAMKTEYVYHHGQPFVEMNFLEESDGELWEYKAEYPLDRALMDATKSSTAYWSGMFGDRAKNTQPWQVFVDTQANEQNAYGGTASLQVSETENVSLVPENFVARQIQDGKTLNVTTKETLKAFGEGGELAEGDYAFSWITIGQNLGANREGAIDGWWVDTDTVLPTNEQAADFVGTFRHELGHALGIIYQAQYIDDEGNVLPDGAEPVHTATGERLSRFHDALSNPNEWALHLVDQNLNPAKPGMEIVTSARFNELKAANPGLKASDFFIVDNIMREPGLTGAKGYAYFVGDHVTEALDGTTFHGVNGLPVNGWEGYDTYDFEGSHLQTAGMMSHRLYSNYTGFMEVELAVMQDLGYDFDRKAYYGRSIYGDGLTITNTRGYSARNADGTAYLENTYSAVPLGVGLHIYGSRNTVTQAANILTRGTGAVGIRVDGEKNTITVPPATEIHADGYRGKGVLFAYGRKHNRCLAGTVTASGAGGNAVEFNFGSSAGGAQDEYRGSYIRYKRDVNEETGNISRAGNMYLTAMDSDTYNASADELVGEQVTDFNLSGTIAGGENAIYIGKNAFVKNINVNEGASIRGNITSDWKHFDTDGSYDGDMNEGMQPLGIQYGEVIYRYSRYIPDLVTNLNFNANIAYSGDITGADNLKLNVNGGTLFYGGTADVVNVSVAKGASVFGGDFTVNDMTAIMADGFADGTTGQLVNHGAIGAATKDTTMNITGRLVSDGVLRAYGGGPAGHIAVNGDADIGGSVATVTNALPGETWKVLEAGAVNGAIANPAGAPYVATGMLNTEGAIHDNALTVTTAAANNLGTTDAAVNETYGAMMHMYNGLAASGDARDNEMRPLFSLDAPGAKAALSSVSSNAAAQSMGLAQTNTMTGHIVSSRLAEAFATKPVNVKIPVANLADGDKEKGIELPMNLPQPMDNDFWFKAGKNWGGLKGGANYHGTTLSVGWDRAYGKTWRAGAFISYGTVGFADTGGAERAQRYAARILRRLPPRPSHGLRLPGLRLAQERPLAGDRRHGSVPESELRQPHSRARRRIPIRSPRGQGHALAYQPLHQSAAIRAAAGRLYGAGRGHLRPAGGQRVEHLLRRRVRRRVQALSHQWQLRAAPRREARVFGRGSAPDLRLYRRQRRPL